MKTTHNVSINDLAILLMTAQKIDSFKDEKNWTGIASLKDLDSKENDWGSQIVDWILDVIGAPPESGHEWMSLKKHNYEQGNDDNGIVLCCRDSWFDSYWNTKISSIEDARLVICSWIDALRRSEMDGAKERKQYAESIFKKTKENK